MELPSEIQYEILMDLPHREIIKYCQTSKEVREICSSERFWNQKALHDFGIPLIMPPLYRYMDLYERLDMYPESMIPILLRLGIVAPIPKLLDSLRIFDIKGSKVGWKNMMSEFMYSAIEGRKLKSLKVLLDYIKKNVPNRTKQLDSLLEGPFFEAVRLGEPEMVAMIKEYYDPERLPSELLTRAFEDQISSNNLPGIVYLQPLLKQEFPLRWVERALVEGAPETIQYFYHRYPQVFQNRQDVNYLAKYLVSNGLVVGLYELVPLSGKLIDFEALRELAKSPEIAEYLSQF